MPIKIESKPESKTNFFNKNDYDNYEAESINDNQQIFVPYDITVELNKIHEGMEFKEINDHLNRACVSNCSLTRELSYLSFHCSLLS